MSADLDRIDVPPGIKLVLFRPRIALGREQRERMRDALASLSRDLQNITLVLIPADCDVIAIGPDSTQAVKLEPREGA